MIKVFEGKYSNGAVQIEGNLDLNRFNIAGIKVIFDLVDKPEIADQKNQEMQELLDKLKNSPKRFVPGS